MSDCNCNDYRPPKTSPKGGCVGCSNKCHEVVDTFSQVSFYRNAFVTVRDENATYHVDEVGNAIAVSRNPIYNEDYEPTAGDYKNTVVYNFAEGEAYVFDPAGNYMIMPLISGGDVSS